MMNNNKDEFTEFIISLRNLIDRLLVDEAAPVPHQFFFYNKLGLNGEDLP